MSGICLNSARLTDIGCGICFCHIVPIPMCGVIVTGSPDVYINNLNSARQTDIVLGFCGHIGIIISGSPTVYVNNLQKARITDPFVGCFTGNIVTGSPDTYTGNEGNT